MVLIFNKGWNYYEWIDSLILDLERFGCFKSFVERIDWDSQLTNILVSNNRTRLKKESDNNQSASNSK